MDKVRHTFEEWFEAWQMPAEANWFKRDPAEPDTYLLDFVQDAWEAWAAAECHYNGGPDALADALNTGNGSYRP